MSRSKFKIIAGLGNPGDKYAQTRHNIGFAVVDAIADQSNLTIDQAKFDSLYVKTRLKDTDLFLIKPMSYMNRSGMPLFRFASYFKVDMEDIVGGKGTELELVLLSQIVAQFDLVIPESWESGDPL